MHRRQHIAQVGLQKARLSAYATAGLAPTRSVIREPAPIVLVRGERRAHLPEAARRRTPAMPQRVTETGQSSSCRLGVVQ